MNEILLDARRVEKQFGGIRALASVDVQQAVGETLGMIGPNGSGKTTFVNVVSGHLSIDAGSISFAGAPISGRRPHAITRAGLTRTYQAVRVFGKLSVADQSPHHRTGRGGRWRRGQSCARAHPLARA